MGRYLRAVLFDSTEQASDGVAWDAGPLWSPGLSLVGGSVLPYGSRVRVVYQRLLTSPLSPVRPCRPRLPLAGSALGGPPWVRLSRCAWGLLSLFCSPFFPRFLCFSFVPKLGSAGLGFELGWTVLRRFGSSLIVNSRLSSQLYNSCDQCLELKAFLRLRYTSES